MMTVVPPIYAELKGENVGDIYIYIVSLGHIYDLSITIITYPYHHDVWPQFDSGPTSSCGMARSHTRTPSAFGSRDAWRNPTYVCDRWWERKWSLISILNKGQYFDPISGYKTCIYIYVNIHMQTCRSINMYFYVFPSWLQITQLICTFLVPRVHFLRRNQFFSPCHPGSWKNTWNLGIPFWTLAWWQVHMVH